MSGHTWYRASADHFNGCGVLSGIRAIRRADGWYMIDGRPGKKAHLCGPFSNSDAARERGEHEIGGKQ